MHQSLMRIAILVGIVGAVSVTAANAADPPSVKLALSFKPKQTDVEYDTPKEAEYDKCKVTVVRKGKASGWVVLGPGGETLRRFMDTDGDNTVDHWGYYLRGLEVYRDIDSNADNKIDQFRWMNTAGSRWGIDNNADGYVDVWKYISAEEASREAVRALISGNSKILKPLLIDESDVKQLAISSTIAKQLLEQVDNAETKLAKNRAAAKGLSKNTRWLQFINTIPAAIPGEQLGASNDLYIYENAMATVETGSQTALIQIGEMVRVGDAWKLAAIPQLMDQNAVQVAGLLMQPAFAGAETAAADTTTDDPELNKLIEKLQELDKNSPPLTAPPAEMAQYYEARADLLTLLRGASTSSELREQWTQQLIELLFAGAQTGVYPDAMKRLKALEAELEKSSDESNLFTAAVYRRIVAEYNNASRDASNDDREELQKKWMADLQEFIKKYPRSSDAPEAMYQLGQAEEFHGKTKEAVVWFRRVIEDYPDAPQKERAEGVVRRFELEGKPLSLSGSSLQGKTISAADYKGKVLAVIYWATWCKPCTEELPQIIALYNEHRAAGFEVLGVNVDNEADGIAGYVQQHKVPWPHIYEPGGIVDSPPAKQYGIVNVPTIFLVDRDGKVVKRNASLDDLKTLVPMLLEGKKPQLGAGNDLNSLKTN